MYIEAAYLQKRLAYLESRLKSEQDRFKRSDILERIEEIKEDLQAEGINPYGTEQYSEALY